MAFPRHLMLFRDLSNCSVHKVSRIARCSNDALLCKRLIQTSVYAERKSTKQLWILGVGSLTGGALIGASYAYRKHLPYLSSRSIVSVTSLEQQNEVISPPKLQPSRQVASPTDTSGLKITLYQYQTCPFCCKVRAYLDYSGLAYDVVEVNPVLRQQLKWTKYKKVPIVVVEGKDQTHQLNDSSLIISALSSYLMDQSKGLLSVVNCYPKVTFNDEKGNQKSDVMNRYFLMFDENLPEGRTKDDVIEEREWRKWTDEVLVHTLSPNVYRTPTESLQAFQWFSKVGEWEKHFAAWERYLVIYVGASAMWLIGKRLKKRHNLNADVRQSLYNECRVWAELVRKKGTPFMGGSKPNLADLSVYGVLSSIRGCDAFGDLIEFTDIGKWMSRMDKAVLK